MQHHQCAPCTVRNVLSALQGICTMHRQIKVVSCELCKSQRARCNSCDSLCAHTCTQCVSVPRLSCAQALLSTQKTLQPCLYITNYGESMLRVPPMGEKFRWPDAKPKKKYAAVMKT